MPAIPRSEGGGGKGFRGSRPVWTTGTLEMGGAGREELIANCRKLCLYNCQNI